jgi:FixJ family two-component response regulator
MMAEWGFGAHPAATVAATIERAVVAVIDDDDSVRESLPDLVREFGYDAHAFASAEEFLASSQFGQPECLILDVALPGMSGPDLQRVLRSRGLDIPIIFITARADDTIRPTLLGNGAVAVLFKPFSDGAMEDALRAALATE